MSSSDVGRKHFKSLGSDAWLRRARLPIYAPHPVFGYWPGTDGGEFMIRYLR